VLVEMRADGEVSTEATIKIWLGGERYVRTAEGNGPVNALDARCATAIGEIHPHLRDIELVNFKVRILDEAKGTGAVTRVLIDASDGNEVWGTIGVSENLIAASWEALVDSLECGMLPSHAARGSRLPRALRGRQIGRDGVSAAVSRSRSRVRARAAEEAAVLEVLRSGSCRSGRAWRSSSSALRRASAPRWRAPSRAARPGCTWRCARSAWARG
jgi:hypothetical protein